MSKNQIGWIVFSMFLSGCTDIVNSSFSNDQLSQSLVTASPPLHPFSTLNGADSSALVCILEPYRSRVDQTEPRSREINDQLAVSGYRADEGHWAVLQLGNNGRLQVIPVLQTERRLIETTKGTNTKSAQCAEATTVAVVPGNSGIAFAFFISNTWEPR
ncbi:hypothetical protein [Caenimonas aquaedulcis]|uniref:Lipoprotein n=1 Tax=Caenimonas aquaedulcis TaxID=2793270 RepID=A0A931MHA5_9BURK|nr:hypothetical protein [Caenimonas aquaedulcis]MBG9388549.1 hypothetical protein [Caenimonas aquaedulcis]